MGKFLKDRQKMGKFFRDSQKIGKFLTDHRDFEKLLPLAPLNSVISAYDLLLYWFKKQSKPCTEV